MAKTKKQMIKINSISGGQTSAYISANYPADYDLFSLVTTKEKSCMFPDKKIRQIVSDKIGREFIGTLEQDEIIFTMLDLEQFNGRKITWLNEQDFDDLTIRHKLNGETKHYVPNIHRRICTTELKVVPLANWIIKNIGEIVETRIGFRANETKRVLNMKSRLNDDGVMEQKVIVGKSSSGKRNKWMSVPYQIPSFPLVNDNIRKDKIVEFWKDKPVRFAYMNNCVGCFHRSELLLNYMSRKEPEKFQWFIDKEKKAIECFGKSASWSAGTMSTYEDIKKYKLQMNLFDDDFNECDSGYCGL